MPVDIGMHLSPARDVEDIPDRTPHVLSQGIQDILADVKQPFIDQTLDEGTVGIQDDFSFFHKMPERRSSRKDRRSIRMSGLGVGRSFDPDRGPGRDHRVPALLNALH